MFRVTICNMNDGKTMSWLVPPQVSDRVGTWLIGQFGLPMRGKDEKVVQKVNVPAPVRRPATGHKNH